MEGKEGRVKREVKGERLLVCEVPKGCGKVPKEKNKKYTIFFSPVPTSRARSVEKVPTSYLLRIEFILCGNCVLWVPWPQSI